ncbi:uncharacterized protein N7506_009450 [Penicillium brevicompactum]|uniref:uncharacterized protein n=1 Tax=Penicillium brevicompactum TaxID=5074 RepID=UPI00253FD74C|nr:uncharacterized protein N7506_009450 [Penicillium brevicompactum]KAJ5326348.1 hypothetical protein N7506_009450 [Penicillium brevicompactum]
MTWLSVLTTPLSFAFGLTVSLLSYLLLPILFIASPVIYLGQLVLYLTLLPLRILIKLEAFIYFMTVAVLIGATVGMALHFTGSTITQALHIEDSPEQPRSRVKRESIDSTPEGPPFDYLETKVEDTKYLPYSTILEEEESSRESE